MLSRTLWTAVLALLAWIPVGRGQAWIARGDLRDRAILSVSALDVAADSPARTVSRDQARVNLVAQKRPDVPRTLAAHGDVPAAYAATPSEQLRGACQSQGIWRSFQPKRLRFPHDAIAPPSSQS